MGRDGKYRNSITIVEIIATIGKYEHARNKMLKLEIKTQTKVTHEQKVGKNFFHDFGILLVLLSILVRLYF
jgi:hypothetical protein